VLHFLSHGAAYLSFTYRKRVYLAPIILILKALKSECDKYIFDRLMSGLENDTYYRGSVKCFYKWFIYCHSDSNNSVLESSVKRGTLVALHMMLSRN